MISSNMKSVATGAVLAAALSACAVGPDYHRPDAPRAMPSEFVGATDDVQKEPAAARWWTLYNDPALNGYVEDAMAANTDLRVAVANVERSRAFLRVAKDDRLPSTDIEVGGKKIRNVDRSEPDLGRRMSTVQGGLEVSYEIDLFGRVRRQVEAARGDWQAAEADRDAVMVAVVGDTVQAYSSVLAGNRSVDAARHTVELLNRTLSITEARARTGLSDQLDVLRIRALRDQRQAVVGPLVAQRDAAVFQLSVLTGRVPGTLDASGLKAPPLKLASPLPVGSGSELLARRPDVRAAERRLAADTARIGVVTSDLYPRISLGGSLGTDSIGTGPAFSGSTSTWSLGSLISWHFPNIAATRARIAASNAQADASLARFDGAVLNALREVETALAAYSGELEQNSALASALVQASRAADVSQARHRVGSIDFISVLDTERTLADISSALVASDAVVVQRQVDLFKALGGGWEQSDPAAERMAQTDVPAPKPKRN
ncbi:TPA: TolC family protein [Stenotrophomonas maltophilia]|uniref:TolC family protein n=1 Tax=Stenotrophomonas maltophilia TaxID=40324 RepID=A0AAJ2MZ82_STEMA|nr:TolC family protein [Stenotrophomonas maltophilia]MDT3468329.1 TolC family protein [Stenotrophomonas maltophilia]